jgi:hypothetical protein
LNERARPARSTRPARGARARTRLPRRVTAALIGLFAGAVATAPLLALDAPDAAARQRQPAPSKSGRAAPAKAPRGSSGAAAPASSSAPAPASTAPPRAPGKTSALGHVADELTRGLGAVPAGALVVASPVASDVPTPKADELAVRVASQIAGRLGVAKAHPQPAALAVARGHAGRAASLVYLQIEIAKGELRVTADLYPSVSNGWERLRNPVPGPRAHAFASAPLDAEIRSFMAPIPLEKVTVHKAKHDEGDVLAVGCGDVDGDGGNELVLVSRERVSIGKLRAGKFVAEKQAAWPTLASRAPVPMRDPLATVLVSPPAHRGEILVGTTDRGGVAIDGDLVAKRQLTGLPVPGSDGDACAAPLPEASAFDGDAVACAPRREAAPKGKTKAKAEQEAALAAPFPRYDALATFELVARDGTVGEVTAAREPGGKLRVRRQMGGHAKPVEVTIEGVGAQLAVGDLDLDGVPEIVTTADAADGDADTLVVSSFKTQIAARLRYPAKDGVRAVAICPPEDKGVPALVAVVGSEVWLVR